MKKILVLMLAAACSVAAQDVTAQDGDQGAWGVGYQGILLGELFQGASVRFSPDDSPMVAQIICSRFSGDIDILDADIDTLEARLAYVLIQRTNSKFYVGGKLGYTMVEAGDIEVDGLTYGLLFGSEWNMAELPELGFNFDVGYDFRDWEVDVGTDTVDLNLDGINVTFGVHYYTKLI